MKNCFWDRNQQEMMPDKSRKPQLLFRHHRFHSEVHFLIMLFQLTTVFNQPARMKPRILTYKI